MAKKDGMYLYNDWLAPFEKLDRKDVGELVIAMMRYFIYGEEPPHFSGLCGMAADFIFPQIDRSIEYSNLGTKAKGVSKSKQPQPHSHIEVSDGDESVATKPQKKTKKKEVRAENKDTENFKRFWELYPNKSGKQEAETVFLRLCPDERLMDVIMEALEKQKATYRWLKEDGRYIPFPAKWLEGRRWEDEVANDEIDPYSYGPYNNFKKKERGGSFDTDDFFEAALRKANPDLYM